MKLRNIALAAAALALPAGAVVIASAPSGAATTPVVFAGTLSGTVKGTITITPAITLTASTVPVKFVTKLTDSSLVASKGLTQKGVTITAATGSSTVTAPIGTSCTTLATSGLPSGVITTKYKTTPTGTAAAATKFKPGSTTVALGPPITATLGGTGTTTAGSFKNGTAGSAASNAKLILDLSEATLLADCSATTGLKTIAFTGVNGASTFTFG